MGHRPTWTWRSAARTLGLVVAVGSTRRVGRRASSTNLTTAMVRVSGATCCSPTSSGTAQGGTALNVAYTTKLMANLARLQALRSALLVDGLDLAESWLLDIILWACSDIHMPAWQHGSE